MVEVLDLIAGIILGGITSWFISHLYFKKSNQTIPEWAKSLIGRLPETPPNTDELLELFQDAINNGEIQPHPVFRHVACPNCKAPINYLKEKVYGDDSVTLLEISCLDCGYSEHAEV